mgnify:CR=1 FL=1
MNHFNDGDKFKYGPDGTILHRRDGDRWADKVLDGVDLNLGISGRSNDYITRCLMAYYDIIKPIWF